MLCAECNAENPEGKKYCGDCGTLLGKTLEATTRTNFRDRQVVEAEITDAVFERLLKWVKWLGIATAIPIAVWTIVLTIFGLRSYSDIGKVTDTGKNEILTIVASAKKDLPFSVESARKDITSLETNVTSLKTEYQAIESNLHDYQLVNQRIAKLQSDLQSIQGQVAGWYQMMKTQTFDAHNWNKLRFTKQPIEPNGPEYWNVELSLDQEPIPASLRIIRHALEVQPSVMKIRGNTVSFTTYSDKQIEPLDVITVQYHPLAKK
jgi:hypothetical protein